jgi:hypothetical protein
MAFAAGDLPTAAQLEDLRPRYARSTVDESVNNTSTLQNDDELFLTVAASSVYELTGVIHINSGSTPDFKIGWTFPTGLTMRYTVLAFDSTGALFATTRYAETDTPAMAGAGVADEFIITGGLVITAGTAGTLQMQFAQNTPTVGNSTRLLNSYIRLVKLT